VAAPTRTVVDDDDDEDAGLCILSCSVRQTRPTQTTQTTAPYPTAECLPACALSATKHACVHGGGHITTTTQPSHHSASVLPSPPHILCSNMPSPHRQRTHARRKQTTEQSLRAHTGSACESWSHTTTRGLAWRGLARTWAQPHTTAPTRPPAPLHHDNPPKPSSVHSDCRRTHEVPCWRDGWHTHACTAHTPSRTHALTYTQLKRHTTCCGSHAATGECALGAAACNQ
jgi:hypothetical protein